jgi:hypothetical protein
VPATVVFIGTTQAVAVKPGDRVHAARLKRKAEDVLVRHGMGAVEDSA